MASKEDLAAFGDAYTKATGLSPEESPRVEAAEPAEEAAPVEDSPAPVETAAPVAPVRQEWEPEDLAVRLSEHGWSERRIKKAVEAAAADEDERGDLLDTYQRASRSQARTRYKLHQKEELERELLGLRQEAAKKPTKPARDDSGGDVEADEDPHTAALAGLREEVAALKAQVANSGRDAQVKQWEESEKARLGERFPELLRDEEAWQDVLGNARALANVPHYRSQIASDPVKARAMILDRSAEDILGPARRSPAPMSGKSSNGSRATESAHRAATHGGGAPPAELSDMDRQRIAYEHLSAHPGDVAGARRKAGLKNSPPSLARRLK